MDTIKSYLETLRTTLGLEQLELNEHNQTFLLFDDTILVQIEYFSETDSFEFLSKVGYLSEDNESVYQRLLEANLFWSGTEGSTLSLDPTSNVITLLRREALKNLPDYKDFEKLLESFVNVTEYWMQEIDGQQPSEPSLPETGHAGGIQV